MCIWGWEQYLVESGKLVEFGWSPLKANRMSKGLKVTLMAYRQCNGGGQAG